MPCRRVRASSSEKVNISEIKLENIRILAGEPAQLSCSLLAGSPVPQLSWSRRHQPLPAQASSRPGSGTLSLAKTTRHDAGEGRGEWGMTVVML